MSGGRLLVVAACLLVGAVMVAMWLGLSREPERSQRPPSSAPLDTEPNGEGQHEAQDPYDTASDDEDEPEPLPEGVRALLGTVRSRGGERLAGAEVEIDGVSGLYTVSDDDGGYRLDRVPLADVTLLVVVRGYAEGRVAVGRGAPYAEERLDVTLEDGAGAAGRVLDPDGKPADDAEVRCVDGSDDEPAAKTDRYGRFALGEQAIGCDGMASHSAHADAAVTTLKQGSQNVLALKIPGSITGVVQDREGKPARTFVVSFDGYRTESGGQGGRRYRQTFSHPQGQFRVTGLAAGTYELVISSRGGAETRSSALRLESGQELKGVRIVLE